MFHATVEWVVKNRNDNQSCVLASSIDLCPKIGMKCAGRMCHFGCWYPLDYRLPGLKFRELGDYSPLSLSASFSSSLMMARTPQPEIAIESQMTGSPSRTCSGILQIFAESKHCQVSFTGSSTNQLWQVQE